MDEQLLQQLLSLVMGQLGGGQGPNSAAGFSPPSGGLQVPVDLQPDGFSVEPDILAQNAQNVSADQLVSNFGSPSGSPAGFPSTQSTGDSGYANQSPDAGEDFGNPNYIGLGTPSSSSDFNFKAAGSAVSGAMNALASGIAKQGQQGMDQAMKLVTSKGADPRLRALMQPVAPIGGTTGVSDVNQAALQQLLALFLPQR